MQLRAKDMSWETVDSCTSDSLSLSCVIPMSYIRGGTLLLEFDDPIPIRIAAVNSIGQGAWSATDSLTTVRIEPAKMNPVSRGSLTNEIQI